MQKIADARWIWHVRVDAGGNVMPIDLCNDIQVYDSIQIGEDRLARLLPFSA